MAAIGMLDWALVLGVVVLGWILAVYLKRKYKIDKRDFIITSFFVAGLTAILIGAYQVLRSLLVITP